MLRRGSQRHGQRSVRERDADRDKIFGVASFDVLHGRELELERLARLLDDARAGRAGALVVLGEPGVGKSALLDEVIGRSEEFLLLSTRGLESESPLAFAALHRLLQPLQGVTAALPTPQARALRVAFGLDGGTVEPFLVALATLSVLAEAAERAPVLCVVDDAHWLDTASRDALLFAARRLTVERILVVLTARTDDGTRIDPTGLDTLSLSGLDDDAAAEVLAQRSPSALPASVVSSLVARTGGNPLALVELPSTLSAEQLAGTQPLPDRLPLTQAVERSFLDRVRRLSTAGQSALLVAAADDSGRLRVVRDAAVAVGAGAEALVEAEQAGLVTTDADTIQVAHPLVRSATYQAATGGERRAVHRALAASLAAVGDTDRRAWHLAASVDGPDLDAADALSRVAVRAERRGGYGAAAAAFERAAALSPDGEVRARLLFDAARNQWLGGHAERAADALGRARQLTQARVLRADVDRLRARLEVNVGSAAVAERLLLDAARSVAADDAERAVEMAVAAGLLRVYDTGAAHDPTSATLVVPAPAAEEEGPRLRTLRALLDAHTADAEGRLPDALVSLADAVQTNRSVLPEQRSDDSAAWTSCAGSEPDIVANLGNTAIHLGRDEVAHDCYTRVLGDGRHTGAVTVVLYALPRLAFTQLLRGEWDEVRHGAHEAVDLATSVGQPALTAAPLAWLALLAALQGDPTFVEHEQRAAEASGRHLGVLAQLVRDLQLWAAATVATNAGDHGGALHRWTAMRVPALRRMTVLERITAAQRAGEHEQAQAELDDLAAYGGASGLPWALAATEHARGLLAPAGRAAPHYELALDHHQGSSRAVDRARTSLAYGELLRRSQQRTDARIHLRAALATFEDLAAEPLAARARAELRASGETARKRDPSTRVALTPMEAQVAQLVARGLSNKDVAAQLWISPRTVAFHLRGVFAKQGVSSRGELAALHL